MKSEHLFRAPGKLDDSFIKEYVRITLYFMIKRSIINSVNIF